MDTKEGEDIILNSKAEFNRCRIGRLTIGEDNKKGEEIDNMVESEQTEKDGDSGRWEREKIKNRRIQEVKESINLERGIVRSPPKKREGDPIKGRKKFKYPLLGEDWGEEISINPSSQHPITKPNSHTPPPPPINTPEPAEPRLPTPPPPPPLPMANQLGTANPGDLSTVEAKLIRGGHEEEDIKGAEDNPIMEDNLERKKDPAKPNIMAGGVSLMEYMRNKQRNRAGTGISGTSKRKRNSKKSVDDNKQEGQMFRYLSKTNKQDNISTNKESKEQEQTNNKKEQETGDGTVKKKMTFTDLPAVRKSSVRDSIKRYENNIISKKSCVMSEGWCQAHNVRLVRQIKTRKTSTRDNNDILRWNKLEFTALVCPAMRQLRVDYEVEAMSDNQSGGYQNKKQRTNLESEQLSSSGSKNSSST